MDVYLVHKPGDDIERAPAAIVGIFFDRDVAEAHSEDGTELTVFSVQGAVEGMFPIVFSFLEEYDADMTKERNDETPTYATHEEGANELVRRMTSPADPPPAPEAEGEDYPEGEDPAALEE